MNLFENRDYERSPYTGLTRQHWIEAAKFLMDGVLRHVRTADAPVLTARKETKVTYPHIGAPENILETERKAEIFEGLARSFTIASVLIHLEPDLTIRGIRLCDYYKEHILRTCGMKGHPEYAGSYSDMQDLTGHEDPFRAFQQTVETAALVIGLNLCREEIWNRYSDSERDAIASFLSEYAHASTVPQNWRLFNMLDLAFLHMEGYPIDKRIMRDHAQAILSYDVGDGWYRDGHSFDYYSCWAFNFYAPLWNIWYGYENEPYLAKRFEENSNLLMSCYPYFFSEKGFTNMWGRSSIYRNASTSAFAANLMLPHSTVDPGFARRICSGSLLQFLERDDFLWEGVPTLGFYGEFTPLVQGYSCAESVLWLGKAFFCLALPKNHPFWTARENAGGWDLLGSLGVKETVLDGPALAFSNHKGNGDTILRSGKVSRRKDDLHGMHSYAKLCYSTQFPWEASPEEQGSLRMDVEAMQYVICDLTKAERCGSSGSDMTECFERGNTVFWAGRKDGVLYRRVYFGDVPEVERHWQNAITLADFPVPLGILRVDKLRLFKRPVKITLGSFGFPEFPGGITVEYRTSGSAKCAILRGTDYFGHPRRMAMTVFSGFDDLELIHSTGSNPDFEKSCIVTASVQLRRQYDSEEPYVLISQVITRSDDQEFREEDLFPIREIVYADAAEDQPGSGAFGPVILWMKDGSSRTIEYGKIEGQMML